MLDALKRLFIRKVPVPAAWDPAVMWAERQQAVFKPVREGEGFVIDGLFGKLPWRLEWGPSQRPYVRGAELRLRVDAGLPAELQAMVLDRVLLSSMESAVFDQYVEGVQTRIDNQTPPEMRWLVMYPKLEGSELGPLRDLFAAVSPSRGWLQQWLGGALTNALLAAPRVTGQPLVIILSRGRVTLRTALEDLSPAALDGWLQLFQAAVREARRVADAGVSAGPPSQSGGWATSQLPPDEPGPEDAPGR